MNADAVGRHHELLPTWFFLEGHVVGEKAKLPNEIVALSPTLTSYLAGASLGLQTAGARSAGLRGSHDLRPTA